MNFFEQELAKVFGEGDVIERPEFAGGCCVGSLGNDLRVKTQFVTCGVADQYEALRLTVLNRTDGVVDKIDLKFRDTMGLKMIPDNHNFTEGIVPYIWVCKDMPEWYAYKPIAEDYTRLRKSTKNYLEQFREQEKARLVYICAPLRGDVVANIEFARAKAAEVFREGSIPICPHLMFPPIADVNNPAQDEQAGQMGLQLIGLCSRVNVYGLEWTDDMWAEIHQAEKLGVPVYTDQKTLGRSSRQKNKDYER